VNAELPHHLEWRASRPYEKGWVCSLKPAHLADELGRLHIGEKAAAWYQDEIARLRQMLAPAPGPDPAAATPTSIGLAEGQLEAADEATWARFIREFLRG
jgi:hypothetical protein